MMNENGESVQYGNQPADYSTDVLKKLSIQFLDKNLNSDKPFFLYISTYAPHGPNNPAPRHTAEFEGVTYPHKESFGEADITDKPQIVRANPKKTGVFDAGDANALFTRRLKSMLAVDEMVKELVNVLDQAGALENTYIIFTSDNGFHMGEHQLPSGKMLPYEEDIRVPFIIRGPGIQPNTQITQIVANIDIAPTIAELAGARTSATIDGRSFASLLTPSAGQTHEWRKAVLIELGYTEIQTPIIAFRAVRTENFIYVEYENGELEYYDLINDPYELNNIADQLDANTLTILHTWLTQLKICRAEECRLIEATVPDNLKTSP
jgi:arylsulfatase A-like enzyme